MVDEHGDRSGKEPDARPALSASAPAAPARPTARARKERRQQPAATLDSPPAAAPLTPQVGRAVSPASNAPSQVTLPANAGDRTINVNVALPATQGGGESKRSRWAALGAAVLALLTAGGLIAFRDVLVFPVWEELTYSYSRDTLGALVGGLNDSAVVGRTKSLKQLEALLDRKGALVPLARSDLLDFVRSHTTWQDSGTSCPPSLATRPDIRLALDIAVRPRAPARKPWFFRSTGTTRPSLDQTNLRGADLRGADLRSVGLAGSCLVGAHLDGADLRGAHWEGVHLADAHLEKALLSGAHLAGARLERARLDSAQLDTTDFTSARLDGATLDGARMQRALFRDASLQRASMEFATGRDVLFTRSRLEGASLNGDTLVGAVFRAARMACATMVGAVLDNATFAGARLEWVSFDAAKLPNVRLRDQDGPASVTRAFTRTALVDAESMRWLTAHGADGVFASAEDWTVARERQWTPSAECGRSVREH